MKLLMASYIVAALATPIGAAIVLHDNEPPEAEKIMMPRDIYVAGYIDDNLAASIHFQLQMLNADGNKDIMMHITSPGGSVYAGLQIYDDMMESPAKVNTSCEGYCMSMAAVLLTAGAHREASENTAIMFHEVSFGAQGKLSEVKIQAKEAERLQSAIDTIIHEHSGLTMGEIEKMESYDHFMSSAEAKHLNLIDTVKEHKKK